MAKLLADENVPLPLVIELRRMGHDVLRVQDLGRTAVGMEDPDVLKTAVSLGRTVLTENAWDFIRLHTRDPAHQGIVTFTRDADVPALALRIHDSVQSEGDLRNQLIRVRRPDVPGSPVMEAN